VSPSSPPTIVVVGSLNRDHVVSARSLPVPGETVHGTHYAQHNGGKGANQAVALSRLGQDVSMVGCVGDDDDGAALLAALADDGVDISSIGITESRTGVAVITVAEDGENSIVVVAGANGDVDAASIDAAASSIAMADIVLAQLEIPVASVDLAFGHATHTVVLNPAPGSKLERGLLAKVDYLIPNRTEFATLCGTDTPGSDTDILRAVGKLDFSGTLIVTLGSDGALAVHDGEVIASATPPTVEVEDTVGAGDAFCAGFCDALARDLGVQEGIEWATACGALATTKVGAQPSMPTASDVRSLLGAGV
jgi:ribokinase